MLLGHARGKVGDLVFSRVNGQQVTRARAAVVKNPQTEKQMIQRILLNTVIQAYSRMSEITDHSFEGVSVGMASMNKFMRENMNALRQNVSAQVAESGSFGGIYAFAPKGVNIFTPNPWILSAGSLPSVTLASVSPTEGAKITIAAAGSIPTYAEVIAALGLQRGDQLTFIGQELYTDARAAFKFARVILDPRNEDGSQADLSTPFLANGIVNLPSPRNEGADIKLSYASGALAFDLGSNSMYGAAVIVSRQKSDGNWLRSNTSIVLAAQVPYELTGSFDLQAALDYTMAGGIDLQSDLYLNNAVRGKKIVAAPTPSPSPDPDPDPDPDPEPQPGQAFALTITRDGVASEDNCGVSVDAHAVQSGAPVEAGKTVQVHISNAANYSYNVTYNGTSVTMRTELDDAYGTFTMPAQATTIVIDMTDKG